MVLLKAGACVPASFFRLQFSCTCGTCRCGVTNEHGSEEEQEGLTRTPKQQEMSETTLSLSPLASKVSTIFGLPEEDTESTESGSTTSSKSDATSSKSGPKDGVEFVPLPIRRKTSSDVLEETWFTPSASSAECREVDPAGPSAVAAAVAAALAPAAAPAEAAETAVLRHRHSELDLGQIRHETQQDWWDDADTKIVPGLEAAPCLTRLLGIDLHKHPGLARSKRRAPWMDGESHACYRRLGARDTSSSYVAWWLNVGDSSLLSVSEVIDRPALERCLANDALGKRMKLLIRAVKCTLPFPGKGPKEADTVGAFFGKGASLSRARTDEGVDVVVLQIDLYYLMLLRLALQNVGFRQGNVVDIILVDWPGQAVLASCRLSVTEEFLKLKG